MTVKGQKPLLDSVYARLRDLILSNVLPAGQKLVDRDLADKLGVSRTPVREALGRLAMMGLVEARSGRGYYVRQYTAEEVTDLYEFRKILEVNAARLAARNLQPAHEQEFDRILEELRGARSAPRNHAAVVESDLEIHILIAKASGNAELHRAIRNLMDKVMCFIWVDWVDPASATSESVAAAHREHEELILSIKKRDPEAAAGKLEKHIDRARDELTKLLRSREELRNAVLSKAVTH